MPAFRNVPSFAQKTKNVDIQKKTALWVVFFPIAPDFLPKGDFSTNLFFNMLSYFAGGERMKFSLIIDETKEEEIKATVHSRSSLTEKIEILVMQYSGTDRIPVFTEDEMKILPFPEIECVFSEDGKTFVTDSAGKKYRIKMRLSEIEEALPSYFIRINKSAVANEKRIDRFSATIIGSVDAVFKSGNKEYVSRRCFAEIKRRYFKK